MADIHYISDSDGANKVYFSIYNAPEPFPIPERISSVSGTVAGAANAARKRTIDFGVGAGCKIISISTFVTTAVYASLLAKFETYPPEQVIYSPDDGVTQYTCSWEPGQSLKPIPRQGINPFTRGHFIEILLRVQSEA